MTQQSWAQQQGPRHGQPRPRYDHGKAATWPREATTQPATRARGLAGGECRDTKFCITTGERGLASRGCVTIQSLYHDRRVVWLARRVMIQTIVS